MENNYLKKGGALMLMLLLSGAGLFAGKPKPDLKITGIDTTRECYLAVTVRNNGPGKLPDEVYTNRHSKSAGVSVYLNGLPYTQQTIWSFDTEKKLQKKGGSVTFVFYQKVSSPVRVKAVVDLYDVVEEAKENNNVRERNLSACSPGPAITRNDGTAAVGPMNTIPNITFLPKSPSLLFPGQRVRIFFDYFTNEKQGVFIFIVPMFGGSGLSEYSTQPSVLKPGGKGEGETYFTFGKGPVSVDAVRFRMVDITGKKVLFEKIVKVKYDFKSTHILAKPPKCVYLEFRNSGLAYEPSSKKIRIRAGSTVFSRGHDWESAKVFPNIYHLRKKNWDGFFWLVDTNIKYAARVTNGTFGQHGGQSVLISGISVFVVGSGGAPQRFVLRFSKLYLEYKPVGGAVQVITENSVLSGSADWRDCPISANTFHIKQREWKGFYWKINSSEKKAYKIEGGSFCTSGGSASPLPVFITLRE